MSKATKPLLVRLWDQGWCHKKNSQTTLKISKRTNTTAVTSRAMSNSRSGRRIKRSSATTGCIGVPSKRTTSVIIIVSSNLIVTLRNAELVLPAASQKSTKAARGNVR